MTEFAELSLAPTCAHEADEDAAMTLANVMGMLRAPMKRVTSKEEQCQAASRADMTCLDTKEEHFLPTPQPDKTRPDTKEEQVLPTRRPDTPRPHTDDRDLLQARQTKYAAALNKHDDVLVCAPRVRLDLLLLQSKLESSYPA